MDSSVRVVISGKVQGVGYRAWTVMTASHLGLKGWVRNRSDGTVEALFTGDEAMVLEMIDNCKDGPSAARVDAVESYYSEETVEEASFTAHPTV